MTNFKYITSLLLALLLFIVTSANATESITYIHTDHLGSPIAATNEDGSVKWTEDYQPFGVQRTNQDSDNTTGFTGHQHDDTLELTYMQARWYHPEIGRFMALDPVDTIGHINRGNKVQGFNRYGYANNNPYKYVDPDGEFINFFIGAAIGFISEGVVQIAEGSFDGERLFTSTFIGAVSGGVGGIAGKVTGKVVQSAVNPSRASGASKVVAEAIEGAAAGGVSAMTSSTLTQYRDTGTVDLEKVVDDAVLGAVAGALGGSVAGKVKEDAAERTLGNPKARTMFTDKQPGAKAGAAAGNATSATGEATGGMLRICPENGCQ